jgi:tetratricopeptide (TPR) repeat protein
VPDEEGGSAGGAKDYTISVGDLQVPGKARKEYRRGLDSLSHGKTADARKHFEKAIRIDPKFGESYEQLGLVYAEQGHYPEAEAALEKAVAIDNHDSAAFAYLGYVYQKAGEAAKAGEQFRRSIQLNDANWLSQMGLGQILLEKKQTAEALTHLRRAQQLHPQLPDIYLLVYNALIYLDRGPEALTELDKFLARFPNDPEAPQFRKVRKGLAKAVKEATGGGAHR